MVGRIKKVRVEQNKDVLYLYQAPRSQWAPSLSPECLKLETWLKMKQIPYEHVDFQSLTVSANSQLPFCKVNDKAVPYSNHMTDEITALFNKSNEIETSPNENGVQTAFEGLIEGRLHWVLIYIRATQANQLPPSEIFQGRWSQFLRPLANKVVANKLKTKADYQGIGLQNAEDVIATGKKDLRAISSYLGDKKYLAGDKPNELDATAFAHLSQFWYIPTESDLKKFIQDECANLVAYLALMKQEYWQDWEEKCRKPTPPRHRKAKDEPTATGTEGEKTEAVVESTNAANGHPEKEPTVDEKATAPKQLESTVEINVAVAPNATTPNGGSVEKTTE